MAFCTLNHVAIELEEPFLLYQNSVDLEERHNSFIQLLNDLLRHPTRPPVNAETAKLENAIIDGYDAIFQDHGLSSAAEQQKWSRNSVGSLQEVLDKGGPFQRTPEASMDS